MEKKGWIVFAVITAIVVIATLLSVLILVPQVQVSSLQDANYEQITKSEYTYVGRDVETLKKQYGVTASDVNAGKKQDKYEEGNINPFTPKKDVNVYNEPTLQIPSSGDKPLTPDQK